MLLAIDVGNTHTVLGVYDGDVLQKMWRVGTNDAKTADEMSVMLHGLFSLVHLDASCVTGAVLATVVPAQRSLWSSVCSNVFGVRMMEVDVHAAERVMGVRAEGAGADRLANAVAAKSLYGTPVIVVDMGTATDMEVVDADGDFLGGVIAPGIETSLHSLVRNTALLPSIALADPGTAIGTCTQEAIQIGVALGEVDRIDGLVRRIWEQLGYETTVVATGGLSTVIGAMSQTVTHINPELTLQGLRILYKTQMS